MEDGIGKGGFGPNDTVPYDIVFSELSGDQDDITVAVVIEGPGILFQKIASGSFTLDANETKVKNKTLQLNDARDGEYTIRLVADDGVFVTAVACLFEVQESSSQPGAPCAPGSPFGRSPSARVAHLKQARLGRTPQAGWRSA